MPGLPLIDQAERDRAIVELDTTFLVEAAAGTGKTTLAIKRLLQAVRTGRVKMEEIVAITFTEKAASELKMRLRDEFDKARRDAGGDEQTRLTLAMRELERSRIHTIHGFCSWLLKERPIEARVDPGFQVLDALETELLLEETWADWFAAEMEKPQEVLWRGLYAGLSPDRFRQIAFELVKQRDRYDESRLASGTYSVDDAIAELKDLLARIKPKLANCIDTTDEGHKGITRLIELAERLGDMPTHQQEFELMHNAHISSRAGAQKNWKPKETLKEIKDAYPALNAIAGKRGAALLRDVAAWLKDFVRAYERAKALRGALDFDDLLLKTRALLRSDRSARGEFQKRFRVLLVDEFQDTDPIQAEIVFFLAEKEPRADRWEEVELEPGKLFLVGDPKQSIYRFRRADIEIYEQAKQIVKKQGEVIHIRQSFRTVSGLIAWVNLHFKQLIQRPEDGGMYQPEYVELHPSDDHHAMNPRVCVLEPTAAQREQLVDANVDQVRAVEAQEVARLIDHLVRSGEWKTKGRDDPDARAPKYRDLAILLHAPQTSLAAYEMALQQHGIPYQVEGGKDYFQSQEVRAVCALLLALDDPSNTRELVGVLRSAVFGFSDEEIFLWAREKPLNHLDAGVAALVSSAEPDGIALHRGAAATIGDALTTLRRLHGERNRHSFAGFLECLYRELKLPELFALKPHGDQRVANLMKLVAVAQRLQDAGLLSVREFVQYIRTTALDRAEEGQSPTYEARDDVVKVLSIHKAKGLEWGIVVLGDLGAGKRAHYETLLVDRATQEVALRLNSELATENYEALAGQEKRREEAEEKRLLYVAATRARDYLVLPWFADHGHYLSIIKGVFNPTHAGEAVASFFPHDGSKSSASTTQSREPIRVSLDEPEEKDRPVIERLVAERVEWMAARRAFLDRANAGRCCRRPSELAEHADGAAKQPLSDAGRLAADRAASFGTLMHEALATMDWKSPASVTSHWRALADRAGLDPGERKRGEEMLGQFTRMNVYERIRQAEEVFQEMPFVLPRGEGLIEGVMDLLFREGDRWTLVDFKTDRLTAEQAVERAAHYRPQLDAYAEALQALCGTMPAKVVVLLSAGREITMD